MLNLNKIIFYLFLLLLFQLIIASFYFFQDTFSDEVIKKEVFLSNTVELLATKKKEDKLEVEVEPRVKSLEDVLVHVHPKNQSDIVRLETQKVKPIIYTQSINLSSMSIEDKKRTFIDMILPSILVAKYRIKKERKKVLELLRDENLSKEDSLWLTKKRYFFNASTLDELYDKMELHPTSIIIAQAVIESGWGTSRFFEKANNVFGIWSFNEHEQRMVAGKKRGTKKVYLKKYKDVEQSINDYFLMLSTKDAYKDFRIKRLESQDPFVLIEELGKYSELRDAYILNLKNTIKQNKLLAYDSYSLDI